VRRLAALLGCVAALAATCAPAPAGDVALAAPGPMGLAYVGLYYGLVDPSDGSWYVGEDLLFGLDSPTWMAVVDTGASASILGVTTQAAYVAGGDAIPMQPYPAVKFTDVGFGGTADFKVTADLRMMVAPLDTPDPDDTSAYTACEPIAGPTSPPLNMAGAIDPVGGGDIDVDIIGQSILQGRLLHVDPHTYEFLRWMLFAMYGSLSTPAPAATDPRALYVPVTMQDFFSGPQAADVGEHPMLNVSIRRDAADPPATRLAVFDSGSPNNFVAESFAVAAGIDTTSTPDLTLTVSGVGTGTSVRPGWRVDTLALDLGRGREGDQLLIGNTAVFVIPDAEMPAGLDAILGNGVFSSSNDLGETSLVEWYVDQRDDDDACIILVFPDPVAVPGDANVDGRVDVFDLAALANHYGGPGGWNDGDFTRDGNVDVYDLAVMANNYVGTGGRPGATVPEPAGLAVLCAGAVLMRRHVRTRQRSRR